MSIETVKKVVELSSSLHGGCVHCNASTVDSDDGIAVGVNHYVTEHGYRVLHVGQQSSWAPDGKQLWHSTVALLGHDNPPADKKPPEIIVGGNS